MKIEIQNIRWLSDGELEGLKALVNVILFDRKLSKVIEKRDSLYIDRKI